MTWLEVIDDAVKIGLGGFLGWLVTKGSRSHEFEKERRRRKQDCLERVVEDLDETESSIDMLMATAAVLVRARKENWHELQQAYAVQKMNENYEASTGAETKLYRSRSKLMVFGFVGCAKALEAYHSKILSYVRVVTEWETRGKIPEDDVRVAHLEVTEPCRGSA
jgi:hypothetical protein